MEAAGLEVELGVHSGVWSPNRLEGGEATGMGFHSQRRRDLVDGATLDRARTAWDAAWRTVPCSSSTQCSTPIGSK